MEVRMIRTVTGQRNGEDWPDIGQTIDLPDHEAKELLSNGIAIPANPGEEPPVVTGMAPGPGGPGTGEGFQHGRAVAPPMAPGDYPDEHDTPASASRETRDDPAQRGVASKAAPIAADGMTEPGDDMRADAGEDDSKSSKSSSKSSDSKSSKSK